MSSSEGSRFTEYTPTDHQALLWIATCMSLTYAGFILAVRMVVKYKVLGLDDAFLAVAYVRSERNDTTNEVHQANFRVDTGYCAVGHYIHSPQRWCWKAFTRYRE